MVMFLHMVAPVSLSDVHHRLKDTLLREQNQLCNSL